MTRDEPNSGEGLGAVAGSRHLAPVRPLLASEREASRRACAAHVDCVTALYGGVQLEGESGVRMLVNTHVADPDWNLAFLPVGSEATWSSALEEARRVLSSRGRDLTVMLDSRRPEALARFESAGWEEAFRFSGLIYPASRATPSVRFPADVEVVEVEGAATPVDEVADVFEAAFGTAVEEGLDPGYRTGIAAGLERAARGGPDQPRLRVTLLRIDGQAAAIGFRVQVGAVVGLYNLGVAPAFRGRRLGGAVTEWRVERARSEGAEVIFLLTEDGRVEASQLKRGFVPGFELVGVTERARSG